MSVQLSDTRIAEALALLRSGPDATAPIDNIVLGYFGSTTISLYNQGAGGIDEVRSYCDPSEVRFALVRKQGRLLFVQFMGDAIRCASRAARRCHCADLHSTCSPSPAASSAHAHSYMARPCSASLTVQMPLSSSHDQRT